MKSTLGTDPRSSPFGLHVVRDFGSLCKNKVAIDAIFARKLHLGIFEYGAVQLGAITEFTIILLSASTKCSYVFQLWSYKLVKVCTIGKY